MKVYREILRGKHRKFLIVMWIGSFPNFPANSSVFKKIRLFILFAKILMRGLEMTDGRISTPYSIDNSSHNLPVVKHLVLKITLIFMHLGLYPNFHESLLNVVNLRHSFPRDQMKIEISVSVIRLFYKLFYWNQFFIKFYIIFNKCSVVVSTSISIIKLSKDHEIRKSRIDNLKKIGKFYRQMFFLSFSFRIYILF